MLSVQYSTVQYAESTVLQRTDHCADGSTVVTKCNAHYLTCKDETEGWKISTVIRCSALLLGGRHCVHRIDS